PFLLDDIWQVGFGAEYLRDAVTFLERHRDRVHVVAAVIAGDTLVEPSTHSIRVTSHRQRRSTYRFGFGPKVRPLHVERVGSHTFGVFPNFLYGFFFNDLVARTDDYSARLRWYLDNISHDAHTIELAARAWRGPVWRHIAVPLDAMPSIDLDYARTGVGTRPEDPTARALVDAIADGWPI